MQKLANDYQVGGSHYKNEYQHWTWAPEIGIGYLDGTATKYLCRWRKKGGLQDLEKGSHYGVKLLEEAQGSGAKGVIRLIGGRVDMETVYRCTLRLVLGHEMPRPEVEIMFALATWRSIDDLRKAVALYETYVEAMRKEERVADRLAKIAKPDPVPLTEENHYSPRVGEEGSTDA